MRRIVLRIHDRDFLSIFLSGYGRAFVEQSNAGLVDPATNDLIECIAAAPERVSLGSGIVFARSLVGDLVSLLAVVDVDDVALLSKLDAVSVGIFVEAPELNADPLG